MLLKEFGEDIVKIFLDQIKDLNEYKTTIII